MGICLDHLVDVGAVQQLLCAICLELMDDPVSVDCAAEHTTHDDSFCRSCVASISDDDLACPTCRSAVSRQDFRPNRFAARLLLAVATRCPYSSKCSWLGDLHGLHTHADACPHNVKACPNRIAGCKLRMASGRIPAHVELCAYGKMACPNSHCSKRFRRKDENAHLAGCAHWACPWDHCPFVGLRVDLVMHQPACDAVSRQLAELREENEAQADELESLRTRYDDLRRYTSGRIGLPEFHAWSADSEPDSDSDDE